MIRTEHGANANKEEFFGEFRGKEKKNHHGDTEKRNQRRKISNELAEEG